LTAATEQILLRFAREALNNAVRHSRCNSIQVCCRQDSGKFALSVFDDGVGFDPSNVLPHKLGLTSLREWASQVGGIFKLDTAPGHGTKVTVRILSEESKGYD
jgi:signal transduction histidine kinase